MRSMGELALLISMMKGVWASLFDASSCVGLDRRRDVVWPIGGGETDRHVR